MDLENLTVSAENRKYLVLQSHDGWPDEPIYETDPPVKLCYDDIVSDPTTNKSTMITHTRRYSFVELMALIRGDGDV